MSTTYRKMTPGGETPTGSVTITENGTYDVTNKASAIVNVPSEGSAGVIRVKNCGASATVTATVSGVSTVTATADSNGIAILFVPTVGTYTVASSLKTTTKTAVVTNQSIVDVNFSRLPDGYTEVEYLESHDGAYIDTEYLPQSTTIWEFEAAIKNVASNETARVGMMYGYQDNARIAYGVNGDKIYFGICQTNISTNILNNEQKKKIKISLPENKGYLNDEPVATGSGSYPNNIPYTLSLFGTTGASYVGGQLVKVVTALSDSKVYWSKIYGDSTPTLKRDFVPCFNSSSVYGLYCLKVNQFFTNAGEGYFTGGNPV